MSVGPEEPAVEAEADGGLENQEPVTQDVTEPVVDDDQSTEESGELPEEGEEEGGDESAASETPWIDAVREITGEDLSAKYGQDDRAAFHGVMNTYRMVGKRDEDAILGKHVRQRQDVMDMLQGKAPAAPEAPVQEAPPILSPEEVQLLRHEVIDPGTGQQRPDADPQQVARLKRFNEEQHRNLTQFGQDPAQFLKKVVEPLLAEVRTEAQQEALAAVEQRHHQSQYNASLQQFKETNASWLFADGKVPPPGSEPGPDTLSLTGRAFERDFLANQQQFGTVRDAQGEILRHGATDLVVMQRTLQDWQLKQQVARKQTLPTKPAAKRKAPSAAPTPGPAREGETFLQQMERESAELLAAEAALA